MSESQRGDGAPSDEALPPVPQWRGNEAHRQLSALAEAFAREGLPALPRQPGQVTNAREEEARGLLELRQRRTQDLLNGVRRLVERSDDHRHLLFSDLEWLVLPAIRLGQFRYWTRSAEGGARASASGAGVPYAYAAWAFVDELVEKRLERGLRPRAPADWMSGDQFWLIDMIAPAEDEARLIDEVARALLIDEEFRRLAPRRPAPIDRN